MSTSLARTPWERNFRRGCLFGWDIGSPLSDRLIAHLGREEKRKQLIVAIGICAGQSVKSLFSTVDYLLLRLLGLGLLQMAIIRIGAFPEGEEIFVFCQCPNAGGLFFET